MHLEQNNEFDTLLKDPIVQHYPRSYTFKRILSDAFGYLEENFDIIGLTTIEKNYLRKACEKAVKIYCNQIKLFHNGEITSDRVVWHSEEAAFIWLSETLGIGTDVIFKNMCRKEEFNHWIRRQRIERMDF